jgi:hypothetical protein
MVATNVCWVCDKPATYLGSCDDHFYEVWGISPFVRGDSSSPGRTINGIDVEAWFLMSKANRHKLSRRSDASVLTR